MGKVCSPGSLLKNLFSWCGTGFQPVKTRGIPRKAGAVSAESPARCRCHTFSTGCWRGRQVARSQSLRLCPSGGFVIVNLDVNHIRAATHWTILDVLLVSPCRWVDGDYDLLATRHTCIAYFVNQNDASPKETPVALRAATSGSSTGTNRCRSATSLMGTLVNSPACIAAIWLKVPARIILMA